MHPLFHILPILPLLSLRVGYRPRHSPACPPGQVKEPPFIETFGRRNALGKQIFPVQSLQNGFQFQQAGTLAEKIGRLNRHENQKQSQH